MQKICVIIPCFNEENRLDSQSLITYIKANPAVHICFVNDGSTDGTLELLSELKKINSDTISIVNQAKNGGKAGAVRSGMLESLKRNEFDYFAYFDADFATPLEEIGNLLKEIQLRQAEFALGSRIKRLGATIERSKLRHLFGRFFSTLASWILDLPVYDTQCGAKIISKNWLITAFEKPFISSWLFDVEILARLRNKYGKNELLKLTVEVPLNSWIEKGGSKIKLIHLIKVPLELLNIHRAYN